MKTEKSMLLIFNTDKTIDKDQCIFPNYGALTPHGSVHFGLEIEKQEYVNARNLLIQNTIEIEKELRWGNEKSKSISFRDPKEVIL